MPSQLSPGVGAWVWRQRLRRHDDVHNHTLSMAPAAPAGASDEEDAAADADDGDDAGAASALSSVFAAPAPESSS
jgi:hypothetical protein